MINELILKTMYTDAIRDMVFSINESIKSRFKRKERNWNANPKHINYPYAGNLHEVSIEVKDITLRENLVNICTLAQLFLSFALGKPTLAVLGK